MNEMTTTKGRRRRFSAEDRGRWVELYERSGEGVREFCRENALCQSSLSRWLRQKRAAGVEEPRGGSFVEVRVAAAATAAVAARVRLPGGMTMEVTNGTDAVWLAGVLRALSPTEA